jgi:hypothetical protein
MISQVITGVPTGTLSTGPWSTTAGFPPQVPNDTAVIDPALQRPEPGSNTARLSRPG